MKLGKKFDREDCELEDRGDRKIILKWIKIKYILKMLTDLKWLGLG
jgi:hypothetical protein